jgi:hypothetical protein
MGTSGNSFLQWPFPGRMVGKMLERNLTFLWQFVIFSANIISFLSLMKKRTRFLNLKMGKRIIHRPKPWVPLPKKKAAKRASR